MNGLKQANFGWDSASSPIKLRLANQYDIPCLRRLIASSARVLATRCYTEAQIEQALARGIISVDPQLIADRTYFVAEQNQQIVGCGGWSRWRFLAVAQSSGLGQRTLLDPKIDAAQVRAIFVHPEKARQGIGRKLVLASQRAAQAVGFGKLSLFASLPGVPLYSVLGFRSLECVEIPLAEGDFLPLIRMEKNLDTLCT